MAMHKPGDLVWAKMKGYPSWPAMVLSNTDVPLACPTGKHPVLFFGTNETGFLKPIELFAYMAFRNKFEKPQKTKGFNLALLEIRKEAGIPDDDEIPPPPLPNTPKQKTPKATPKATSKSIAKPAIAVEIEETPNVKKASKRKQGGSETPKPRGRKPGTSVTPVMSDAQFAITRSEERESDSDSPLQIDLNAPQSQSSGKRMRKPKKFGDDFFDGSFSGGFMKKKKQTPKSTSKKSAPLSEEIVKEEEKEETIPEQVLEEPEITQPEVEEIEETEVGKEVEDNEIVEESMYVELVTINNTRIHDSTVDDSLVPYSDSETSKDGNVGKVVVESAVQYDKMEISSGGIEITEEPASPKEVLEIEPEETVEESGACETEVSHGLTENSEQFMATICNEAFNNAILSADQGPKTKRERKRKMFDDELVDSGPSMKKVVTHKEKERKHETDKGHKFLFAPSAPKSSKPKAKLLIKFADKKSKTKSSSSKQTSSQIKVKEQTKIEPPEEKKTPMRSGSVIGKCWQPRCYGNMIRAFKGKKMVNRCDSCGVEKIVTRTKSACNKTNVSDAKDIAKEAQLVKKPVEEVVSPIVKVKIKAVEKGNDPELWGPPHSCYMCGGRLSYDYTYHNGMRSAPKYRCGNKNCRKWNGPVDTASAGKGPVHKRKRVSNAEEEDDVDSNCVTPEPQVTAIVTPLHISSPKKSNKLPHSSTSKKTNTNKHSKHEKSSKKLKIKLNSSPRSQQQSINDELKMLSKKSPTAKQIKSMRNTMSPTANPLKDYVPETASDGNKYCIICQGAVRPQFNKTDHKWRCINVDCRQWYSTVGKTAVPIPSSALPEKTCDDCGSPTIIAIRNKDEKRYRCKNPACKKWLDKVSWSVTINESEDETTATTTDQDVPNVQYMEESVTVEPKDLSQLKEHGNQVALFDAIDVLGQEQSNQDDSRVAQLEKEIKEEWLKRFQENQIQEPSKETQKQDEESDIEESDEEDKQQNDDATDKTTSGESEISNSESDDDANFKSKFKVRSEMDELAGDLTSKSGRLPRASGKKSLYLMKKELGLLTKKPPKVKVPKSPSKKKKGSGGYKKVDPDQRKRLPLPSMPYDPNLPWGPPNSCALCGWSLSIGIQERKLDGVRVSFRCKRKQCRRWNGEVSSEYYDRYKDDLATYLQRQAALPKRTSKTEEELEAMTIDHIKVSSSRAVGTGHPLPAAPYDPRLPWGPPNSCFACGASLSIGVHEKKTEGVKISYRCKAKYCRKWNGPVEGEALEEYRRTLMAADGELSSRSSSEFASNDERDIAAIEPEDPDYQANSDDDDRPETSNKRKRKPTSKMEHRFIPEQTKRKQKFNKSGRPTDIRDLARSTNQLSSSEDSGEGEDDGLPRSPSPMDDRVLKYQPGYVETKSRFWLWAESRKRPVSPKQNFGLTNVDAGAAMRIVGKSLTFLGHRLAERPDMSEGVSGGTYDLMLDSLLSCMGPLLNVTRNVPALNHIPDPTLQTVWDSSAAHMPVWHG